MTDLTTETGQLPAGLSWDGIVAVCNGGGLVVANLYAVPNYAAEAAYYWTASGGWNPIPILTGNRYTIAEAANSSGQVVGLDDNGGEFTAIFWSINSGIVDIGALGSYFDSAATGISLNGLVVGYGSSGSYDTAFQWVQGDQSLVTDGSFSGGTSTNPTAVNSSGEILASAAVTMNGNSVDVAVAKSLGGSFEQLNYLNGSTEAYGGATSVSSINDDGVAVGSSTYAYSASSGVSPQEAVEWTSASAQPIGLGFFNTFNASAANGINNSGQIIGEMLPDGVNGNPFIYSPIIGMQDLNAIAGLPPGTLVNATQIDDFGNILAVGNDDYLLSPIAPTASASINDVDTDESPVDVDVTFTSVTASLNTDAIGESNILVTGLSTPTATILSSSPQKVVVQYQIAPPSGGWTTADNGNHFVQVESGAVTDQNDLQSGEATASVTIDIPAAPTVTAVSTTAAYETALQINVLAHASSSVGINNSSVALVTGPTHGTAVVNGVSGLISYTPGSGFVGTDTFTFDVQDVDGDLSAPATVTVMVGAAGAVPFAADDSAQTPTGNPVNINVLANDTSSVGLNPASVQVTTAPADGTALVNGSDGSITYTPATGFAGTDTFQYTVAGTAGNVSLPATVTVTVKPATSPVPVAADETFDILGDTSPAENILGANDPAASIGAHTLVITQPTYGMATVLADDTITYTPPVTNTSSFFVGQDQLTYTFEDGNGVTSTTGVITFDVGLQVAKTASQYVSYKDPGSNIWTLVLTGGTADVFFGGAGTATLIGNTDQAGGRHIVTRIPPHANVSSYSGQTPIDFAQINVSGSSVSTVLGLASASKAGTIALGGISDTQAIGTIKAPNAELTGVISAASIGTLTLQSAGVGSEISAGDSGKSAFHLAVSNNFDASLNLPAGSLAGARIGGSVTGSDWSIEGTAGAVGVGGSVSQWNFSAGAAVKSIQATSGISNSGIFSGASVGSIIASTLTGDTILVGTAAGTTLADVGPANINFGTLGTLRVTSTGAGAFSSTVIAWKIKSATLQSVDTVSGGGLASSFPIPVLAIQNANGSLKRVPTAAQMNLSFGSIFGPGGAGDFELKIV